MRLRRSARSIPRPHGPLTVRREKRPHGRIETKIEAPPGLRRRIVRAAPF